VTACNRLGVLMRAAMHLQAYEVPGASPPGAVDLARRLRDAGAHMFGAFWCSHCQDQKQAFGREAMAVFPYEECYPQGWKLVRARAAVGAVKTLKLRRQ
jgi:hypothetical protein